MHDEAIAALIDAKDRALDAVAFYRSVQSESDKAAIHAYERWLAEQDLVSNYMAAIAALQEDKK